MIEDRMKKLFVAILSGCLLFSASALAQSTPSQITGIGSAFPNSASQGDTKWSPSVDQWNVYSGAKEDYSPYFPKTNVPNTWSATQTFSVAPVFTDQPGSRAALGVAPTVTSNTALSAISTVTAPYVYRSGYAAAGDSPTTLYKGASSCPYNGGVADNGGCVSSSDNKFWVAQFSNNTVPVGVFGVLDTVDEGCYVTATSGNTTISFSGCATFTSADVGKKITIYGAGSTSQRLTTSISSVTNGTTIVVANAPTQSMSSAFQFLFYGTDQATALQHCSDAATLLAYTCVVPQGHYLVATGIVSLPPANSQSLENNLQEAPGLINIAQGATITAMASMNAIVTYGGIASDYSQILRSATFGGGTLDGNFLANYGADVPFFIHVIRKNQVTKNTLLSGVRYGNPGSPQSSAGAVDQNNFHQRDIYNVTISAVTKANPAVATCAWDCGVSTGQIVSINSGGGTMTQLANKWYKATKVDATHISLGVDSSSWGTFTGTASMSVTMPSFSQPFTIYSPGITNATPGVVTAVNNYAGGEAVLVYNVGGMTVDGAYTVCSSPAPTSTTFALCTAPGVTSFSIGAGGSGYTYANVVVTGGDCQGVVGTASISGGAIASISVTQAGSNCAVAPTVTIVGDGTGATATATLASPTQVNTSGAGSYSGGGYILPHVDPATAEKWVYLNNATDYEMISGEGYSFYEGVYADKMTSGYDSKIVATHFFNYPSAGRMFAATELGGDNTIDAAQEDCPAFFAFKFWSVQNGIVGSRLNCSGFALGYNPDALTSFLRLDSGATANIINGGAKGDSGSQRVLQTVSAANSLGVYGTINGFGQFGFVGRNVEYTQPDMPQISNLQVANNSGSGGGSLTVHGNANSVLGTWDSTSSTIGGYFTPQTYGFNLDTTDNTGAYTGNPIRFHSTYNELMAPAKLPSYTLASTIPTCTSTLEGALVYVTDATAPTWNSPLSSGGSYRLLALCSGGSWYAH
jgi:hypothetical protein